MKKVYRQLKLFILLQLILIYLQENAEEIIKDFIKEARLQQDAFENKKIKIENNPGFDISIETKNTITLTLI